MKYYTAPFFLLVSILGRPENSFLNAHAHLQQVFFMLRQIKEKASNCEAV